MKARLVALATKVYTAGVKVKDKDAELQLAKLALALQKISATTAHPDIKVEGVVQAEVELLGLEHQFRKLNEKTNATLGPLGRLAAALQKVADTAKGKGGPAWLGPALLALPAVTTLAGVAAGAVIALGGAFIAGGGALLAFAAVAKPVLSDALKAAQAVSTAQNTYQATIKAGVPTAAAQARLSAANASAQLTYNAALAGGAKPARALAAYHLALAKNQVSYNTATNAGTYNARAYHTQQVAVNKAYAEMSPQQIALSKQLGSMAKAWQGVKASLTPLVAGALQPWLKGVTTGIGTLGLVIRPLAPVIQQVGTEFAILMSSPALRDFMRFLGTTGGTVVQSAGTAIINVLTGLITLLPKFTPLINSAAFGISKWSNAFLAWSSSKKASDQIRAFLKWFHDNGPAVGALLKSVGAALKALAPGLTAGGALELKIVTAFLNWVARLPKGVARPLAEVAGALLILNKLGVVKVGVKLVGVAAAQAGIAGFGAGAGGSAAGSAAAGAGIGTIPASAMAAAGAAMAAGLVLKFKEDVKSGLKSVISDIPKLFEGIGGILGLSAQGWADAINNHFRHTILAAEDRWRHDFSHWFDDIRHDAARWGDDLRHIIAGKFDGIRHDIAHYWDLIWSSTTGRVQRGIADVVTWFKGLPGRVLAALSALGSGLKALGSRALGMLLAGLKSAAGGVLSWLSGFAGKILGFFSRLLHHSPTGDFYHMGRNMMEGLAMGIRDHAHLVATAAQKAAFGAAGGALGGKVSDWISRAMAITRVPASWFPLLMKLVGLESGGDPLARNLSPAGIAAGRPEGVGQVTIGTFAANALPGHGNIWNPVDNLIAAIRHILGAWGSIFNIPGLLGGSYQGYSGGGVIPEPVLGRGLLSGMRYSFAEKGPERVTPGLGVAGGGGLAPVDTGLEGHLEAIAGMLAAGFGVQAGRARAVAAGARAAAHQSYWAVT